MQDKRKTWLWALVWLIIFPLPLTILLLRKKDMSPRLRCIAIAGAWLLFVVVAVVGMVNAAPEPIYLTANEESVEVVKSLSFTPADEPTPSLPLQQGETDYVINTNSGKFHLPSCGSVDDIKPSNRQDYSGSREELISLGYSPCKRCKP